MFTEYTREEIENPLRPITALSENEDFKAVEPATTENESFEAKEYVATDYTSPNQGHYDLEGDSLW